MLRCFAVQVPKYAFCVLLLTKMPHIVKYLQADKPFRGLSQFGTGFLSKFESSQCPCPILESVTFIDTPGVLSGEKQRIGRSYDFVKVVQVRIAFMCSGRWVRGCG